MKTVLILVDALRYDYLDQKTMPYLHTLSKMGLYIKKIEPNFGFCERTEILTGVTPNISGNFTAIGYDPQKSEYKKAKHLFTIFSYFPCLDKYFRYVYIKLLGKNKKLKLYKIPFKMLSNLVLTEDGEINYGNQTESITEILAENNRTFDLSKFTSLATSNKKENLFLSDEIADFTAIYIGEIDTQGHKLANNIKKMNLHLLNVDNQIKNIVEKYKKLGVNNFVVLGDHGMEPVKREFDIIKAISSSGLKQSKDYDLFVDSTICRIWTYTEESKKIITELLNKYDNYGSILTDDLAAKRNIDIKIKNSSGGLLYGDIIWCANVGVLLYPDYFNGLAVHDQGMHGYFDIGKYSYGTCIILGNNVAPNIISHAPLYDICPTLCDLLQIRYPKKISGNSLFSKEEI